MSESIEQDRLKKFRGAPFSPEVVEAAVGSIRKQTGWHIAPERVEEAEVDTINGRSFQLDTAYLLDVLEIRDGDNPEAEPFDGKLRVRRNGKVTALTGRMPAYCIVSFRHGYEKFPADLLPVVADRARASAQGRIRAESLASRSITFEVSGDPLSSPIVDLYRVRPGPA